jgi:hypothetical protein
VAEEGVVVAGELAAVVAIGDQRFIYFQKVGDIQNWRETRCGEQS